jgi:hypothetical protein
MPALAAGGLTINKYEPQVGLAVLSNHSNELPAPVDSAIL